MAVSARTFYPHSDITMISGASWFHHAIAYLALLHAADVFRTVLDMSVGPMRTLETGLWLLLYIIVLASLFLNHNIRWINWFIRFRLLLFVILAVTAASMFWSLNPLLTIKRSIHIIGTTLIGFYIGFHFPKKDLILILERILIALMVSGALVAMLLPEWGQQFYEGKYVWKGLLSNKNAFGFVSGIAVLFFAARLWMTHYPKHLYYLVFLVISCMNVVMSDSATALATLLISIFVVSCFAFTTMLRLHGLITLLLLLTMGCAITVILMAVDLNQLTGVVGRSADLTGRTDVWYKVWTLVEQKPWLGFGYGSIWFPDVDAEQNQQAMLSTTWLVTHAHNGFLQVASELGLPIAFISVLFLVQVLIEPVTVQLRRPSALNLFLIGFLSMIIISNAFEARFLIDRNFYWILFIALPIGLMKIGKQ